MTNVCYKVALNTVNAAGIVDHQLAPSGRPENLLMASIQVIEEALGRVYALLQKHDSSLQIHPLEELLSAKECSLEDLRRISEEMKGISGAHNSLVSEMYDNLRTLEGPAYETASFLARKRKAQICTFSQNLVFLRYVLGKWSHFEKIASSTQFLSGKEVNNLACACAELSLRDCDNMGGLCIKWCVDLIQQLSGEEGVRDFKHQLAAWYRVEV